MEQWNEEDEIRFGRKSKESGKKKMSLREIAWTLFCDKENDECFDMLTGGLDLSDEEQKRLYKIMEMDDEYDSKTGRDDETDVFANFYKECRNKLNQMLYSLTGYEYDQLWEKNHNRYEFEEQDALFLGFLISIATLEDGKNIRAGEFKKVDETTLDQITFGLKNLAKDKNFRYLETEFVDIIYKRLKRLPEFVDFQEEWDMLCDYVVSRIIDGTVSQDNREVYEELTKKIRAFWEDIQSTWEEGIKSTDAAKWKMMERIIYESRLKKQKEEA